MSEEELWCRVYLSEMSDLGHECRHNDAVKSADLAVLTYRDKFPIPELTDDNGYVIKNSTNPKWKDRL